MKKFTLWWPAHPEKDMIWYEREKTRMTSDEVARELDINYSRSLSNKVFHEFNAEKHLIRELPKLDKRLPILRVWDFGKCNATLYIQVDDYGRKKILHERVLGKVRETDEDSDTVDQAHAAIRDTENLFKGFEIIDLCDPQGSYTDSRGPNTDVKILNDDFKIFPEYEYIKELPTKIRKKRGITMVKRDLQFAPGGKEAFQIYVSPDNTGGCPTLLRALQGGYSHKTDINGNWTDAIKEVHPYEDVVDCMVYAWLYSGAHENLSEESYEPVSYNTGYVSNYLGY